MRSSIPVSLIRELIEADVDRLLDPDFARGLPRALEIYRQALLAYHRGDGAGLGKIASSLPADALHDVPELPTLIHLRRTILARDAASADIDEHHRRIEPASPWAGEILILLAAVAETIEDFHHAQRLHLEAAAALGRIEAWGKALRAEANSIVNLTNIDSERRYFPEYMVLLRRARKLKQFNIVATTYLNLSREYQRIGANQNALRFCNRAIAAAGSNPGGLTAMLAVAHRAHLLHELDRPREAEVDFELASTSTFPAVQAACSVLAGLLKKTPVTAPANAPTTWKERAAEDVARLPLSVIEEKVVRFLAEKPRKKFDITDHLFGEDLHPLTAENRLKNLIHRIRRKRPGLIVLKDDHYCLADPERELQPRKRVR